MPIIYVTLPRRYKINWLTAKILYIQQIIDSNVYNTTVIELLKNRAKFSRYEFFGIRQMEN